MWMDIVVAVIFVLSTAAGYRAGFIRSLFHAVGWIVAIVLAFILSPHVKTFLTETTGSYDKVYDTLYMKFSGGDPLTSASSGPALFSDQLPTILQDVIETTEKSMASGFAGTFSGLIINVVSILIVVLLVRLLFLLLSSLFSKKNRGGMLGFTDGVLGLAFGVVKGILLIFFLLALLVPIISIGSGTFFSEALMNSKIAGQLYDNNLILLVLKGTL